MDRWSQVMSHPSVKLDLETSSERWPSKREREREKDRKREDREGEKIEKLDLERAVAAKGLHRDALAVADDGRVAPDPPDHANVAARDQDRIASAPISIRISTGTTHHAPHAAQITALR